MAKSPTKTAHGYITIVQELRFRMMTDTGQSLLLTLANNANADYNDLCRLLEQHAHVAVGYTGEPNMASGIAHAVRAVSP